MTHCKSRVDDVDGGIYVLRSVIAQGYGQQEEKMTARERHGEEMGKQEAGPSRRRWYITNEPHA